MVAGMTDDEIWALNAAATIRSRSTPRTRPRCVTRASRPHPGQDHQGLRMGESARARTSPKQKHMADAALARFRTGSACR